MWAFLIILALGLMSNVCGQDCSGRPRYGVHPTDCCASLPRFMTPELAVECGLPADIARQGPGGRKGPPSCEAVQCILRKNNLLTGDKVNRSAFKTYMNSQYSGDWLSAVNKAVQTCNTEINVSVECEPKQYMGCFKHNMFINCPANVFLSSNDACNQLKAHFQNCPKPSYLG